MTGYWARTWDAVSPVPLAELIRARMLLLGARAAKFVYESVLFEATLDAAQAMSERCGFNVYV
jgi:hypothetical protein